MIKAVPMTRVKFIEPQVLLDMELEDSFYFGCLLHGISEDKMKWTLCESRIEDDAVVKSFDLTYFGVPVGAHCLVVKQGEVFYREGD